MSEVVLLDGPLEWSSFDIPGGTPAVSLARLRAEPDTRALTVLVRFPEGWQRPGPGAYEAAEDVVFLDGTLEMSGETYGPGDWAYIPEHALRIESLARTEVLALARFSGPARWVNSGVKTPAERARLEGERRALREGVPDSSWFEPAAPRGTAEIATEVLALGERAWTFVDRGETFPSLDGPCFCRTFKA